MDEKPNPLKELFDELFTLLETLETQNLAVLQFLKDQKVGTDKKLAPYLERAGNASSVKWRAARVRMEYLLSPVEKKAKEQEKEKAPEQEKTEAQGQEKAEAQQQDKAKDNSSDKENKAQEVRKGPNQMKQEQDKDSVSAEKGQNKKASESGKAEGQPKPEGNPKRK